MKTSGHFIRVSPEHKTITKVAVKHHPLMLPRLLATKAENVAMRGLLMVKVDGTIDLAPARMLDAPPGATVIGVGAIRATRPNTPAWKLKGYQTDAEGTAGVSYLFGLVNGGVCSAPLDIEWYRNVIAWVEEEAA